MEGVVDTAKTVTDLYEIAPILGVMAIGLVGSWIIIGKLWRKLQDQTDEFKEYAKEYKEIAKDWNRMAALIQDKLGRNV